MSIINILVGAPDAVNDNGNTGQAYRFRRNVTVSRVAAIDNSLEQIVSNNDELLARSPHFNIQFSVLILNDLNRGEGKVDENNYRLIAAELNGDFDNDLSDVCINGVQGNDFFCPSTLRVVMSLPGSVLICMSTALALSQE